MENNLPSESFRPEDEYPALDAQPIEAAEPVIAPAVQAAEEPVAEPAVPAGNTVAESPSSVQPRQTAPAAQAVSQPQQSSPAPQQQTPASPVQQTFPQNTIPYMTYPIFPPMPGMAGYPQQYPTDQQYPAQQPYMQGPFIYPDYTRYFAPQQQQQSAVQPQTPAVQQQTPAVQQTQKPQEYAPFTAPAPQTGMPQQTTPQTAYPQPQPQPTDPVPQDKKAPTSTGTKAFLIILSALMLAMIAGFIVYIYNASSKHTDQQTDQQPVAQIDSNEIEKIPDEPDSNFDIIDNDGSNGSYEMKHTELEEEITLVADDGATQKRDTDNPDSIGKPDKNAKGIELKDLPKDADKSSAYTAKSAYTALVDSVVTISCYKDKISDNTEDIVGGGSGVIFSADGYIITNAHVLGYSKQYAVNVTLNSGDKYQAKIVGYDSWTDLAVLKIDAKGLKAAEFGDSEKVEVGDNVIAIGSPGGAKYQNSLTQGVVSAVDREISVSKCVRYIQSDAAINPGSSGGPLCNIYGQVIGVTTAKTVAQYYESMSFSIPSSLVKDIVTDLLHYGYIPNRPRIGFAGSEVTTEDITYFGVPAGVIVSEISDDGALKGTGVKVGDIVTAIDGEKISSFQDIYNILAKHKSGDKVKLSLYRLDESGILVEEPTAEAK